MKYYYGNNYKEAMSNPAVDIETTEQLEQYRENYNVVIPVGPDLPDTVTVNISDLDYSPEDSDDLEEILSDWLSDEYGYCHNGFEYDTDATTGDITIDNIDWDIEEEEEEDY